MNDDSAEWMANLKSDQMRMTVSELRRFWSKVALPSEGGCCLWLGAKNTSGYGDFSLRGRMQLAHRLALYLTDGMQPGGKTEAAHSCRNRHCVAPAHLRWATTKENFADRIKDDTMIRGERNGRAVLTDRQVLEIRQRSQRIGVTQAQLAAEFGVSRQTISSIVNGKRWAHLGGFVTSGQLGPDPQEETGGVEDDGRVHGLGVVGPTNDEGQQVLGTCSPELTVTLSALLSRLQRIHDDTIDGIAKYRVELCMDEVRKILRGEP